MTYWVAAIVDDQIIMGADSRGSSVQVPNMPLTGDPIYSASDVSEKLFTNYGMNKSYKLSIVTSGLASTSFINLTTKATEQITIAEILHRFLDFSSTKEYSNATQALNGFIAWLQNSSFNSTYVPLNNPTQPFRDYVLKHTNFCFGLVNSMSQPTLSTWKTSPDISSNEQLGQIIDDWNYIEADFNNHCFASLSQNGTIPFKNVVNKTGSLINFVTTLIAVTARDQYGVHTIGGHIDTAWMGAAKFQVDIGDKKDIDKTRSLGPMLGADHDRVSVSTVTTGVPGDLIAFDLARQSINSRNFNP